MMWEVSFNLPGNPGQRMTVKANSSAEAKQLVQARFPGVKVSITGVRTV